MVESPSLKVFKERLGVTAGATAWLTRRRPAAGRARRSRRCLPTLSAPRASRREWRHRPGVGAALPEALAEGSGPARGGRGGPEVEAGQPPREPRRRRQGRRAKTVLVPSDNAFPIQSLTTQQRHQPHHHQCDHGR